jgi:hypothetical protein
MYIFVPLGRISANAIASTLARMDPPLLAKMDPPSQLCYRAPTLPVPILAGSEGLSTGDQEGWLTKNVGGSVSREQRWVHFAECRRPPPQTQDVRIDLRRVRDIGSPTAPEPPTDSASRCRKRRATKRRATKRRATKRRATKRRATSPSRCLLCRRGQQASAPTEKVNWFARCASATTEKANHFAACCRSESGKANHFAACSRSPISEVNRFAESCILKPRLCTSNQSSRTLFGHREGCREPICGLFADIFDVFRPPSGTCFWRFPL